MEWTEKRSHEWWEVKKMRRIRTMWDCRRARPLRTAATLGNSTPDWTGCTWGTRSPHCTAAAATWGYSLETCGWREGKNEEISNRIQQRIQKQENNQWERRLRGRPAPSRRSGTVAGRWRAKAITGATRRPIREKRDKICNQFLSRIQRIIEHWIWTVSFISSFVLKIDSNFSFFFFIFKKKFVLVIDVC